MHFERRNTSLLVANEKFSSSICVSACDTLGCDPVLIAGECGGVPGSSDLVTTAVRRGDGSHSDDVLFSPARFSPITLSGCTEISGSADGLRQINTVTRFQAHPSGFCTGYEALVLVRPVVPYSLALSPKGARPVVSLAPSADRCLNPSFLQGCCPSSQALLSFTNSK